MLTSTTKSYPVRRVAVGDAGIRPRGHGLRLGHRSVAVDQHRPLVELLVPDPLPVVMHRERRVGRRVPRGIEFHRTLPSQSWIYPADQRVPSGASLGHPARWPAISVDNIPPSCPSDSACSRHGPVGRHEITVVTLVRFIDPRLRLDRERPRAHGPRSERQNNRNSDQQDEGQGNKQLLFHFITSSIFSLSINRSFKVEC